MDNELFGELHEQEEYKLYGKRHERESLGLSNVVGQSKQPTKRCFCGAEFDGIQCNSCGFDASEVDIY